MIVALKELGRIITGNTPSKKVSEYWSSDDICFVKPDTLDDKAITIITDTNEKIAESAKNRARIVEEDTILVTCIGVVGKVGITGNTAAFNQQINAIVPNNSVVPKYLAYALMYNKPKLQDLANAPVVPIINKSQFGEFKIKIDSDITNQKSVVKTLDKTANIINARKQELQTLDELIKARFVEMFGDIITNSKNWNCGEWKQVLTIKNGKNQKAVENPNGKYPICGSGGIMGYADDYITDENSVIIGRKGNINKPILMREKYWNVDTAFGLEPDSKSLCVDYLYYYCVFFDFEKLNKAVTIPSLTKADLLKVEMPLPPIELQNSFTRFVQEVDKSKVEVQKALDEAQLLFDSLMQEYFG